MWQDDVLQIIEGLDYETVTIRANGEPQDIRVYPFPSVYDALVNAGAIPNTYADMPGIDYRTVYAFTMDRSKSLAEWFAENDKIVPFPLDITKNGVIITFIT